MARIRTIKPEFWTSEQVVECSLSARLLFIGIWNFCDDAGIHPDSPKRLKMQVFPADEISTEQVSELIEELISNELLTRYEVDGRTYLQVTGWQHQKIDKPTFRHPKPNSESTSRTLGEASGTESESNRSLSESNGMESKTGRESDPVFSDDGADPTDGESWLPVADVANRVCKTLSTPTKSDNDRSLVLKVSWLSIHRFGEHWLWDAVEGVAKAKNTPAKPYAYLHQCLANSTARLGKDFAAQLASIDVPNRMLARKG